EQAKTAWAQPDYRSRPTRCACRKSDRVMLVMQSAQDWSAKNVSGLLNDARRRRILLMERCLRISLYYFMYDSSKLRTCSPPSRRWRRLSDSGLEEKNRKSQPG